MPKDTQTRAKRCFRFILTRDATESATVTVWADSKDAARDAVLEEEPVTFGWSLDDGNYPPRPYITDTEELRGKEKPLIPQDALDDDVIVIPDRFVSAEQKLDAIRARLHEQFDSPALRGFGQMTSNTNADLMVILSA